jgi:Ala-tRNA(Pro) deacylase
LESPQTFEKLKQLLVSNKIEFTELQHAAVRTSEEAAQIRGVSLASGAKAMLLYKKKKSVE